MDRKTYSNQHPGMVVCLCTLPQDKLKHDDCLTADLNQIDTLFSIHFNSLGQQTTELRLNHLVLKISRRIGAQ